MLVILGEYQYLNDLDIVIPLKSQSNKLVTRENFP